MVNSLNLPVHLLCETVVPDEDLALLVDGGIHEEAHEGGSRPVDGHGDGGLGIGPVTS
jgi:hypothetical protein